MKRTFLLLALLFVASSLALASGTTITLLHVNDTHSHLDAFGPKDASLNGTIGGIARAATVIGTVKATEPNVLLLHGGDIYEGDPFFNMYFGVPELQIMQQLGFDAMAVGNHEFDFGPDVLNGILGTAFPGGGFPLLSANLNMDAYPALKSYIQPSIIKQVGGVKIGIFGLTIPNEPTSSPAPVVVQDNVAEIAQLTAAALRAQGAEVVVLLSHCGIYVDRLIAANTAGIDFLVGAHDHFLFDQPVIVTNALGKSVPIFQAGEFYKYVGELHFTVDAGVVTMNDYRIIPVDAGVTPDATTQAVIDNLKAGISAKYGDLYGTVVATAAHELGKKFDPTSPVRDTPMGNLVTDAFRAKTGTQIAITALGLISEKLYEGPIVGADVFRSMSYGYDQATGLGLNLVTLKIRGSELLKGLEFGLSQLDVTDDFFLQVSGLRYKYEPKREVGHRIVQGSIKVNGGPFILHKMYSVTVDLGAAMLLDKIGIAVEDLNVLPDFEYTVVRDFLHDLGTVDYRAEGRIWDNSIHSIAQKELKHDRVKDVGNFPNPFNPKTFISYTVAQQGFVSVRIYNLLGQQVATLVNNVEQAGPQQVAFDGSNLPSGIYFYRVQSGAATQIGKMMLLK